ncbi:MAG: DUF1571 domain-containing protein [Phycisphaerae bacterium]|jgi:hypothetical protein|nr:DUF1571 domain-containing protein [Phycisphaerae bacterium]
MLEKLLHPTNRRVRILVGILLAGLFCIQCTQSVTGGGSKLEKSTTASAAAKIEKLAREDHVAFLEMCLDNYNKKYRDYTCTLIKQEVIRGTQKPEQWMNVKFRDKPFSVAMRWLDKTPKGALANNQVKKLYVPMGDRILYIEGKYDNKMVIRISNPLLRGLLGTQKRPPDGTDAMKNTLRPVSLFGFKRGIKSLLKVYQQAAKKGHLKQEFGGYVNVAGRDAIVLLRYLPPKENYPAKRTEICIDLETLVPIRIKGFDWDGQCTSRYVYKDVKFNVGLDETDFTPKANETADPK